MEPVEVALLVFACVFGGALIGMYLRTVIPAPHFSGETKEVVTLVMGLVATMAALVLGLVIATAKGTYDEHEAAMRHTAARILMLDHLLSNYGPETREARAVLERTVSDRIESVWPQDRFQRTRLNAPDVVFTGRDVEARILQLSPQTDAQRWLQSQALQISGEISETRWLVLGNLGSSIPVPFLLVVVFWLTIIFGSFGLFAPRNGTVLMVLFLCALSVAGSIFLILEMDQPFEGLMKVSSAPLRYTLSHLGR